MRFQITMGLRAVIATGLFLLSAASIVYVLFGYPLLLAVLSRHERRPVERRFEPRRVSILLPVWNGEPWIRQKLESIAALDYPRELVEVIVISDGSTDRTEQIVREFSGVRLITLPRGGKALALNAGLEEAGGEILFFTDVRQQLDPSALRSLVECFADPSVGVASGELVILRGARSEEADVGLYWRYEKWIRERLSRIDSVIGATGAIYAMRRELAKPMPPETLLDDVFLPLAAFFQGYRVILDRRARAYDYPTSLDSEFRRKVRTLAGNYQLLGFYPELLGPRNRMWFHYVSHKFGRLMLPFALLLLLAVSFGLPGGWGRVAVLVQTVFYAAAALDLAVPQGLRVKRLTSIVRTFVVLQAAALCAISFFFVGPGSLWRQTRVGKARP